MPGLGSSSNHGQHGLYRAVSEYHCDLPRRGLTLHLQAVGLGGR
jgi:hypothetical protein